MTVWRWPGENCKRHDRGFLRPFPGKNPQEVGDSLKINGNLACLRLDSFLHPYLQQCSPFFRGSFTSGLAEAGGTSGISKQQKRCRDFSAKQLRIILEGFTIQMAPCWRGRPFTRRPLRPRMRRLRWHPGNRSPGTRFGVSGNSGTHPCGGTSGGTTATVCICSLCWNWVVMTGYTD